MTDCLFCRIIEGEVPSRKVYEDDLVVAFRDITPQAPTHIVIVPRKHVASLSELAKADDYIIGHLVRIATEIAALQGIASEGYRLVANCGAGAGQSVDHLHFHLLGGRPLGWPPG